MNMNMSRDKIEKKVLLKAPRAQVWRAITDSREFGIWFGMKLQGPFQAGKTIHGEIAMTQVDPEVAKMQEPYVGAKVELQVESLQPEKVFSFRWHPGGVDPDMDYSREPMTLVSFALEEQNPGVLLTITESGFEKIPEARRAEAYEGNEGGWAAQLELIQKYLAREKS
jgi:uncharacterized protein YndB with AHSA1/START domain